MKFRISLLAGGIFLASCTSMSVEPLPENANLSPENWGDDYATFMAAQDVNRTSAGAAQGYNGAVTVAYNGLAARAGLEALEQGGNAIDAAMTTAMAQVALTAGAPISYFGILSLVYYDAETDQVYTMNAEWNTLKGETDPMSIPGGIDFSSDDALYGRGNDPSGRTALVGGFMKGVEAAHTRFGKLPFEALFEPSIYIAENGMPVTKDMAGYISERENDLARLPETKSVFTKDNGEFLKEGDIFKQPALAETLRQVAANGTDYMYKGPWGEALVAAVQADGGVMTMEDLTSYEVLWDTPLKADIGNGYAVYTNPYPNLGGLALIEAQNLADASGLSSEEHWTKSGDSLRKALDISAMGNVAYLPPELVATIFPGLDFSPESRVTNEHAEALWARMEAGAKLGQYKDIRPKHSDDVVVIDKDGNIAAITHSINAVLWGRTAINVGGISISDAAAIQREAVAAAGPGNRLPAPTETGIVFKDGTPVLGFASMGSGLHPRTLQGILNFTDFGMSVEEAINTPDFFLPTTDPKTFQLTVAVPEGRFAKEVLDDMGYAYKEIPFDEVRFNGEGKWVAISRDPETGLLEAGSHNRNNSDAVAY